MSAQFSNSLESEPFSHSLEQRNSISSVAILESDEHRDVLVACARCPILSSCSPGS
jgi:hypothetical protein